MPRFRNLFKYEPSFNGTSTPDAWAALVPWGAVCALALAAAMAAISASNAHPDELYHVRAAEYYITHWLPPKVGDPATLASYSAHGWSYLIDFEPVYFFAGKLAALISGSAGETYYSLRLFQLLLMALLCLVLAFVPSSLWLLAPIIISPQIWYVFGYFNADAFPLVLSLLLATLLLRESSPLMQVGSVPDTKKASFTILVGGVLLGLLALSKLNYLPFVGLVVALLLFESAGLAVAIATVVLGGVLLLHGRGIDYLSDVPFPLLVGVAIVGLVGFAGSRVIRSKASRRLLVRQLALVALAAAIAATPLAYDNYIHGGRGAKATAVSEIAETMARADLRPSQLGGAEGYPTARLQERGVSFYDMLLPPYSWLQATAASATGLYGYMTIHSPKLYYVAIGMTYLSLLLLLGRVIHRMITPALLVRLVFLSTSVLAVALLAALHSWVNDFQPQGRYLFPIVAMVGIALHYARRGLRTARVGMVLGAAFLLSVGSFVLVGLRNIPRAL